MPRQRVALRVTVDLDPVPGTCHDPDDWERWLTRTLQELVGHYKPKVEMVAFGYLEDCEPV